MRTMFYLSYQEFRRSWRALGLVVVILFLGFLGPLLTMTVKTSTEQYLQSKARELLQGDLLLSSLRPYTDEETAAANQVLKPQLVANETKFISMVEGLPNQSSALTEIHGVDENYPVYGSIRIREQGGNERNAPAGELKNSKNAWVAPEILTQLNLKLGDSFRLGKTDFKISGEILAEGALSQSSFGLAPMIYISRDAVTQTGLTAFGSQVFYRRFYRLEGPYRLDKLAIELKRVLPSPDIFLRTPDDSVQGFEKFLTFFTQYLSAITVSVFVLSWVASFYILQVFIQDHLRTSAILMTLGASRGFALASVILQMAILLMGALLLAVIVGSACLTFLTAFFRSVFPADLVLSVHSYDFMVLAVVALISALAFSLPLLLKLHSLKLSSLFDDDALGVTKQSVLFSVASYAPLLLVFFALMSWMMESVTYGIVFLGGLVAAALASWVIGRASFRFLYRIFRNRPGRVRLIFMNLSRGRFGTDLCFFTLLQLALVLNLVPHLLFSVVEEVRPLQHVSMPSFFLFNIQEQRLASLRTLAIANKSELQYESPMILARLTEINGVLPASDFLQRYPVRLSYRKKMIPSETLLAGHEFPDKGYDSASVGLPLVSIEQKFAERSGIKLDDTLEFDVQGLPVKARVANFRRVRWSDFHPNFFIEFQPGVLDDAPKTWVASVHILDHAYKSLFQRDLIHQFADVSVIDIDQTIQRVISISNSVIAPVQAIAWIAVAFCSSILLGVILHNLRLRRNEFDIEKMLGADLALLRGLKTAEFSILATMAALTGLVTGLLASDLIARRLLDIESRFDFKSAMVSTFALIVITSALAFFAANAVLNRSSTTQKL